MFCPECGSEYREGFTRCKDCDVDLVAELTDEPEYEEEDGLAELHQTTNPVELEALVAQMERAEIPYLIQAGTAMNLLQRSAGLPAGVGAWEARLWVDVGKIKEARERQRLVMEALKKAVLAEKAGAGTGETPGKDAE